MEPPQFGAEHLITEEDFVEALGTITMKDEDGKEAQYPYRDVWRFRDGKMVALTAFVIKG